MRTLSVLLAAATIPPFYAIASRLFDVRAARIGSLLLVANSYFVYYAQEARSYSLALLLVVVATYAWTRWLERPSGPWTVAYAVAAALSVYAHLFSLFVIAAHAAALAVGRRERPGLPRVARVYALLALLLFPLMLYFATGYTGQLWWVREPSLGDLAEAFATLSGAADPPAFPLSGWILLVACGSACCLSLLAVRREWRADPDPVRLRPYVLLLAWLLLPTLGAFVVSFWKPIFVERYLIVALPALVMLVGAGLASIGERRARLAAVGAVVALSIAQLVAQYGDETKEDWRGAVDHLSAHAGAGDAVVVYAPYVRIPFDHYLEQSPGLTARVTPLYPEIPWGGIDLAVDQNQPPDLGELARAQDRYERIWLVLAHNGLNDTGVRTTERLSRGLGADRVGSSRTFPGISVRSNSAP